MQIKINDNLTENIKDISVSTGGGVFNLSELNTYLLNLLYPIGSIFINVNDTNPATLFGGTWVQLKDRFLLGAGDTYTNGSTGGASTVTLTTAQMPSHKHSYVKFDRGITTTDQIAGACVVSTQNPYNGETESIGGGQAHENMPPYLVVYMWKRTA